ncbi:hypothetical protein F444_21149 [Phytophthora nicotianae P1976]|uniref:EF-hand domain-containing protein n=1 Tax=Phytophthora nicotianae P1976 TaxID=1317066 RepID=A0A080Z209_PHYNI|nr:hypothetical protein F444_21149 [Phytophthora nicotianae P1976]
MTAKPAKVRDYEQSDSSRSKTAQSSDSSKTSKGGGDTPSTAPAPARKKKKKKDQENENASNSTSKGGETKTSKKRKSPTKSDVEAQSTVQSKVSQRKVQPKHKNFSNLLDSKSSTIAVSNAPEAATPEVDEPGGLAGGNFGLLLETKQAEKLCLSLGLQKRNVEAMRRFFDHEEELGTGDITIDEFFSMLHEQPRQLTKGLFEAVGLVRNLRRIRFDEFVICIATVATWSKSELLHYAFKQFDIDESGVMDGRELRAFCEGLKNDSSFYFANNVNKAREKLVIRDRNNRYQYFKEKQSLTDEDIEANTVVDLEDLAKGSTEFQVAFYPLLQLQQSVRSCAPGERFWAKVAQRRQEVEVIVHYMRMHKGELPSFSIVKRIIAYLLPSSQANAQLAVHKLAILKYAEEERIWQEQAHARAEADKLAQTGSQE